MTTDAEANPPRASYALFVLTLIFVLANIDRNIINMLLEPIRLEFGMPDWQLGLLSGFAFSALYAISGVWISRYADRHNRVNIIAISLTLWSFMTMVCGMVSSAFQLMLARAGVGLGEGGCSPPAHSLISDYFPPSQRATALGVYASGATIGLAGGFLLGGWLGQEYGWRVALLAVGAPGLLIALVFRLTVADPRYRNAIKSTATQEPLMAAARRMWKTSSLRHVIIAAALSAVVASGTITFVPSFLMRTHGLTPMETGLSLAVVSGLFASSGVIFGGWITDRLARTNPNWNVWVPALAKLIGLPGLVAFFLIPDRPMALAVYCIPSFLSGMWLGPTYAMVQSLVPATMRSTAAAVLLLVYNILGLGAGPVAIGALSDIIREVFGGDSLRTALLCITPVSIWAAAHYLIAGRSLKEDLEKVADNAKTPAIGSEVADRPISKG